VLLVEPRSRHRLGGAGWDRRCRLARGDCLDRRRL